MKEPVGGPPECELEKVPGGESSAREASPPFDFLRSLVSRRSLSSTAPISIATLFVTLSWLLYSTSGRSFAFFDDNESFLGPWLANASRLTSLPFEQAPMFLEILGGLGVYNSPQLSTSYPLYFTWLIDLDSPEATSRLLSIIIWLHLYVLLFGSYFLLRTLGMSTSIASVMSLVLVVSPNIWTHATWFNIIAPISWMPWAIALYIRLLKTVKFSASSTYTGILLVAVIVMVAYSSLSQPLMLLLVILAMIMLFHILSSDRQGALLAVIRTLNVALASLGIAAPIWVSSVLEFSTKLRWVGPGDPIEGFGKIPLSVFEAHQLTWRDLLFMLDLGNVTRDSTFIFSPVIGVSMPFLAVLGVYFLRNSRTNNWLFPILAIYGVLSSLGTNTWLFWFNYAMPLLSQIREPQRFLIIFQISVVVLAAYGLRLVTENMSKGYPSVGQQALRALAGLMIFMDLGNLAKTGAGWTLWSIMIFSLGIVLAIIIALANPKRPNYIVDALTKWAQILAAVATIAVLSATLLSSLPPKESSLEKRFESEGLFDVYRAIQSLDANREYRLILDPTVNEVQLKAMFASYFGIDILTPYFNPLPKKQFELMFDHGGWPPERYEEVGARFYICQDTCKPPSSRWELVVNRNSYTLYENIDVRKTLAAFTQVAGPLPSLKCDELTAKKLGDTIAVRYQCDSPPILSINIFQDGGWKVSGEGTDSLSERVDDLGRPEITTVSASGSFILLYSPATLQLANGAALASILCVVLIVTFRIRRTSRLSPKI